MMIPDWSAISIPPDVSVGEIKTLVGMRQKLRLKSETETITLQVLSDLLVKIHWKLQTLRGA